MNNLSVAVITLHAVKNYGSVLQTYATQSILSRLGCNVKFINYIREDLIDDKIVEFMLLRSQKWNKNAFSRFIFRAFYNRSISKRCEVFNDFLKENINLTKPYYSNEEILRDIPPADMYCTGSDQTWNSRWNRGIDKAFYLQFAPKGKRKIAYAASFGVSELEENEKEEITALLREYSAISVREKTGVEIIHNVGLKATNVIDPTLMLKQEEWETLITSSPYREKYILVYQLSKNPNFNKYVLKLSKEKHIKIIRVSMDFQQAVMPGTFKYCPSVGEFLSLIKNAEYIVTDSFHATAFSINFNKNFVNILPEDFSSRLVDILKITKLTDRIATNYYDTGIVDRNIDYSRVNSVLDEQRRLAMNFLTKCLICE